MSAKPQSDGRGEICWEDLRTVHLIAIAGVGMTALAGLLKARGVSVRGSDEQIYPPMSDVLADLGIEIRTGFNAVNLQPRPDLVIVGNKISRGNSEAEALLASDIPYLSLPSALGRLFLQDRRSLVVAGTHGKSTSTAMLASVLRSAGRDPGMMVGAHALDFGGNFALGAGQHFVVEGDEYDSAFFDKRPKFIHYRPSAIILTAVEFDHADIYADLEAIKSSFRELVNLLPDGAPLIVSNAFPHALEIAETAPQCRVETFGSLPATWSYDQMRDTGKHTVVRVSHAGRVEGEIALRAPGVINVRNAMGVYAMARNEGLTHAEIAAGLAEFSGVARRQELVGVFSDVTLIDDFAHHPTAVEGILRAMRERYPKRRMWALFEPRSNTSRRAVFQDDYARALAHADEVVLAEVFRKNSDVVRPDEELSTETLVADLAATGISARVCAGGRSDCRNCSVRSAFGRRRRNDVKWSFWRIAPNPVATLGATLQSVDEDARESTTPTALLPRDAELRRGLLPALCGVEYGARPYPLRSDQYSLPTCPIRGACVSSRSSGMAACDASPCIALRARRLGSMCPFSQRLTVETVTPIEWANSSWVMLKRWRSDWIRLPCWLLLNDISSLLFSSTEHRAGMSSAKCTARASPIGENSTHPAARCGQLWAARNRRMFKNDRPPRDIARQMLCMVRGGRRNVRSGSLSLPGTDCRGSGW